MNENAIRREIVEVGKRLFQRDMVAANDGNISVRVSDTTVLITPTGVSKGYMDTQSLLRVNIADGKVLNGNGKASSETPMHLTIYRNRPDVMAVVHAHPPTATGFAVAGIAFDDIALPEAVLGLGNVALTDYATPTTNEVAQVVLDKIKCSDVLLLANHGAVAVGDSLTQAYFRMESLEQVAKITLTARLLGNVNLLNTEQQSRLFDLREKMGLRDYCLSCNNCGNCTNPSAVEERVASQASSHGVPSEAMIREIVTRIYTELSARTPR